VSAPHVRSIETVDTAPANPPAATLVFLDDLVPEQVAQHVLLVFRGLLLFPNPHLLSLEDGPVEELEALVWRATAAPHDLVAERRPVFASDRVHQDVVDTRQLLIATHLETAAEPEQVLPELLVGRHVLGAFELDEPAL